MNKIDTINIQIDSCKMSFEPVVCLQQNSSQFKEMLKICKEADDKSGTHALDEWEDAIETAMDSCKNIMREKLETVVGDIRSLQKDIIELIDTVETKPTPDDLGSRIAAREFALRHDFANTNGDITAADCDVKQEIKDLKTIAKNAQVYYEYLQKTKGAK